MCCFLIAASWLGGEQEGRQGVAPHCLWLGLDWLSFGGLPSLWFCERKHIRIHTRACKTLGILNKQTYYCEQTYTFKKNPHKGSCNNLSCACQQNLTFYWKWTQGVHAFSWPNGDFFCRKKGYNTLHLVLWVFGRLKCNSRIQCNYMETNFSKCSRNVEKGLFSRENSEQLHLWFEAKNVRLGKYELFPIISTVIFLPCRKGAIHVWHVYLPKYKCIFYRVFPNH